ncbi:MAG: formate--tetrahydrofolate ligase [Cyanobacteriota bacterium]
MTKSDLEIAKEINLLNIGKIASKLDIKIEDLEFYGKYKAKLPLNLIDKEKYQKNNLILVTSITSIPAGEGKTTTSIGLVEGMNKIGKKTIAVLREPSLGPVFGIKGGATGGGYSQVLPMEDINLHFTGDLSAVEKAHNLLLAMVDNNIQNKKNNLNIDPRTVSLNRVMDMNDRSLRKIVLGLGGSQGGIPREGGFDITAASEVMAILCLSENLMDLREKLGNIFVGFTFDKKPVFAKDLKANGAMTVLLKDAIKPNLVQTIEGNPAILHGGPFANIAQGTNSIIATKMGLSLADYVVTEAGFGSDLGAEKFFDIKCRNSGLSPKAVVIVCTLRALRYHGGANLKDINIPNIEAVKKGLGNLEKHIENISFFGVPSIVAMNAFINDTDEEINLIKEKCSNLNVQFSISKAWEKGGEGTIDLAEKVVETISQNKSNFKFLYDLDSSIEEKINTISSKIYGSREVLYTNQAKEDIKKILKLKLEKLPICIAKTQKSLSDNPKLLGKPQDFSVTVREIKISSGAGFLIPIMGDLIRMPGLPETPAAENIDIDENGNIYGLF